MAFNLLDLFEMEIWSFLLTFIVMLIVTTNLYWYLTIPSGIPPGPYGLPIVGSMPFLGKTPHLTLNKLSKQYGQVFRMYLGSKLVIVLNDYTAVKEALIKQSDKFWSRPTENAFQVPEIRGEMPADDDTIWKEHRRFALKAFRNFGVGTNNIEPKLMEEIQYFVEEVGKHEGKPFNPKLLIDTTVANNICNILFGKRFEYGDKQFQALKRNQDQMLLFFSNVSAHVFFPWARHIPGINSFIKMEKFIELIREFQVFIKEQKSRIEKCYENGKEDNYTHAYITEKQERALKNMKDEMYSDNVYVEQAQGLFGAGMETTSTHLKWAIIYMALYPEVQKKIQNEIDSVIGKDRIVQWEDRTRTPLTEAAIMEVHRIVTLVPLNVPHSNVSEANLFGYRIPVRSYVISNLWNIHHDPELWDKPDEFRPERFINDKNQVVKPEYFIPFSVGKHACLGEGLARMESYLYFVTLLQKFSFEVPKGKTVTTESAPGAFINTPKPYEIVIRRRK